MRPRASKSKSRSGASIKVLSGGRPEVKVAHFLARLQTDGGKKMNALPLLNVTKNCTIRGNKPRSKISRKIIE